MLHFIDSNEIAQRNKSTRIWKIWLELAQTPNVQPSPSDQWRGRLMGMCFTNFRTENKIEMRGNRSVKVSKCVSHLICIDGIEYSDNRHDFKLLCSQLGHYLRLHARNSQRKSNKLFSGLDDARCTEHSVWRLSKSFLDCCTQKMVGPLFETVRRVKPWFRAVPSVGCIRSSLGVTQMWRYRECAQHEFPRVVKFKRRKCETEIQNPSKR